MTKHKIALSFGMYDGYLTIDDGPMQRLNMLCITWKGKFVDGDLANLNFVLMEPNPNVKMNVRLIGENGVLEPEVLRQKLRYFIRKELPWRFQRKRATVVISVKHSWSPEARAQLRTIVMAALR